MSPIQVFKDNNLLATIGREGGTCHVLNDIDVYYMGDTSRLYTVAEKNQLVDKGQIPSDLPVVLAIHSRIVPHPDFGEPADIISEYLRLVYEA
ncbi:MAG: hypothetical protein WAV40_00895 [Microgenomates group bacterium]